MSEKISEDQFEIYEAMIRSEQIPAGELCDPARQPRLRALARGAAKADAMSAPVRRIPPATLTLITEALPAGPFTARDIQARLPIDYSAWTIRDALNLLAEQGLLTLVRSDDGRFARNHYCRAIPRPMRGGEL